MVFKHQLWFDYIIAPSLWKLISHESCRGFRISHQTKLKQVQNQFIIIFYIDNLMKWGSVPTAQYTRGIMKLARPLFRRSKLSMYGQSEGWKDYANPCVRGWRKLLVIFGLLSWRSLAHPLTFLLLQNSTYWSILRSGKGRTSGSESCFFRRTTKCQSLTLFDNICHQQSGFAWHLQIDPTSLWDHPGVISELL